ncbi:rho GTPase-activating protein SYDE1 [Pangasianodon hypophthalmus]|uniref:rho GTPase-activating protein SYDE1 n=1 Tax=Pangasianodon hypophthalmus TaxID=310915 RepID=UPI0023079620|nr:rho GTPase-activating protein SYDE1 [Pangasianodon hypophthalmus]
MAEPLLKRTLSKLRGKDRSRRKTDPRLNDGPRKTELVHSSSSSSVTEMEEEFTRHTQITVSKKQNWAKLSSTSRDVEQLSSLSSVSQERESSSGKPQASKQASFRENGFEGRWKDLHKDGTYPRAFQKADMADSADMADTGLPELVTPPVTDYCTSLGMSKLSGQGVYLQHLERSSRAWVLSSGKTQAPDEAYTACFTERRHVTESESNIWYNPIPEEEDTRASVEKLKEKEKDVLEDPWRRREVEGAPEERRDILQQSCHPDALYLGSSSGGASSVSEGASGAASGSAGSSGSPGAQTKSSGGITSSSSMMEKIKSPGTVRRLSMKMRKLPELRRKLSLRSSRNQRHVQGQGGGNDAPGGTDEASPPNTRKESSNNVITRYHLDTSAPARPRRRSSRMRSASKGGYLSDGDSPELLPKQDSSQGLTEGSQGTCQETQESPQAPSHRGWQDAVGSFRHYSLAEQPRCAQRVSGLLTVHLLGVSELVRSRTTKDVFCAIQVDGVTRARTALLTCQDTSLPLNHTFNLELERARMLKLIVLTPAANAVDGSTGLSGQTRNRVCCLGAVAIPPLFKASRTQQLCVKLEPRGLLYVKLTLLEQWEAPSPRLSELPPPSVFGVELRRLVEKEACVPKVPLIIQKCVAEIEKRGLKVVGLYRLCGSAAVKKELRDAFEKDSAAVTLNEELYPDINVITGILKDYLRELPSPLITRTLYEVVLEAMCVRPACRNDDTHRSHNTVALLQCLPEPERATLSLLLDHLSLVASFSDCNLMTCQNLAVCFGPVLLTPTQDSWKGAGPGAFPSAPAGPGSNLGGRSFTQQSMEMASAVDFKRHIEALHYLLQLWPIPTGRVPAQSPYRSEDEEAPPSQNSLQRCAQRPSLRMELPLPQDVAVVSRRGRGRLESPPCNRYAGDWSVCGRDFLTNDDADYDEVAGSESDEDEEKKKDWVYTDDFALDFDAPFTCRLSLKDFDNLISDLERELAKQINICL